MMDFPKDLDLELPSDHWLAQTIMAAARPGEDVCLTIDVPRPADGGDPKRVAFRLLSWEMTRDGRHGVWSQVKIRFLDHARHRKWIESLTSWPSIER